MNKLFFTEIIVPSLKHAGYHNDAVEQFERSIANCDDQQLWRQLASLEKHYIGVQGDDVFDPTFSADRFALLLARKTFGDIFVYIKNVYTKYERVDDKDAQYMLGLFNFGQNLLALVVLFEEALRMTGFDLGKNEAFKQCVANASVERYKP